MTRTKGKGGKKGASGRKPKAGEAGLSELINAVWTIADQKRALRKLAEDCESDDFRIRHEARKLLMPYKFGRPKESVDLTSGGKTISFTFNLTGNAPIKSQK